MQRGRQPPLSSGRLIPELILGLAHQVLALAGGLCGQLRGLLPGGISCVLPGLNRALAQPGRLIPDHLGGSLL
jgi:hypothetical protein